MLAPGVIPERGRENPPWDGPPHFGHSSSREINDWGTGLGPGLAGAKEKWGQPCGRPHSHRRVVSAEAGNLTPGVFKHRPKAASPSPGARAGAGSIGSGYDREDLSQPSGGSEADLVDPGLKRLGIARRLCLPIDTGPESPAFRLQTLAASTVWDLDARRRLPSHPSTARHSPSRRSGSEIPSSQRALGAVDRKSQSPFRCLEDARDR